MPLGVFESGIQDHRVSQVYLIFLHHREFVHAQACLGDDPNDIPQVLARVAFNHLLLRPSDIARPMCGCSLQSAKLSIPHES
jgi:hypothetical protein